MNSPQFVCERWSYFILSRWFGYVWKELLGNCSFLKTTDWNWYLSRFIFPCIVRVMAQNGKGQIVDFASLTWRIKQKTKWIPSWELTYPIKITFEDDFPFLKVGYVSSLEGTVSGRVVWFFLEGSVNLRFFPPRSYQPQIQWLWWRSFRPLGCHPSWRCFSEIFGKKKDMVAVAPPKKRYFRTLVGYIHHLTRKSCCLLKIYERFQRSQFFTGALPAEDVWGNLAYKYLSWENSTYKNSASKWTFAELP